MLYRGRDCEDDRVKSYVLRYWEDELDLHIGRNELGHRYYTGEDIQLFLNIKELKNRGLQLRAIHDLLPKIARRDMSEPKGEGRSVRNSALGVRFAGQKQKAG